MQVLVRISGYRRIGVGALAIACAAALMPAAPVRAQDKPGPSPDQGQAQTAPATSPAAMFAKHGLIGTFAQECTAPTRQNGHVVHRANSAGQVDRHVLVGDPTPAAAATIDNVAEQGARLEVSQVGAGGRIIYVMEVDRDRFRTVESKQADGTVLIANGHFANSNAPTQWLIKCPP